MPKKPPKCPYCAAGHKPDQNGEHWIVKRLGFIAIKKCRDASKSGAHP